MGPKRKPVSQESEERLNDGMTDISLEADELAMAMGFSGFGSTKGQHVLGNKDGELRKAPPKQRKYRRYLFVKGAYNITLTKQQLEEKQAKDAERKANKQVEG